VFIADRFINPGRDVQWVERAMCFGPAETNEAARAPIAALLEK
jgi:hypothetical protein